MDLIKEIKLIYKNFQEERKPSIGIYYIFPNFQDKGLCREFQIDIPSFINYGKRIITPKYNYEFLSESQLLDSFERNNVQGIETKTPNGIDFKTFSEIIADIHLNEFLKRHNWLRNLNL